MTEVTIKIPEDIKDIIGGITEPLYVEALREVARKRFAYKINFFASQKPLLKIKLSFVKKGLFLSLEF